VRFGQVHLFNNYYTGSKSADVYANSYSVGAGANAKILSNANVFEIAGAANCDAVVKNPGDASVGAFKDTGSLLNGAALGACAVPSTVTWTVPYTYTARPASMVKASVLASAGGGKLSTAITGTGKTTVDTGPQLNCPTSGLYFCEDFRTARPASGRRRRARALACRTAASASSPKRPAARARCGSMPPPRPAASSRP
jgi:hypothetical protein